ncbi:hypothetical protein FC81_GL000715 [Liquorilactobacillus capillatus DSM 19910]|uniref:Uncharacterized protein n=2 Tax=Liquorilactobacillus capillatus TaxID=480931 RepID=A0A0R1M9B5_9LACO|nr:hypothetical protein FC81_GL000715 [Liquorilactobacillus capillatus DSM 19910]
MTKNKRDIYRKAVSKADISSKSIANTYENMLQTFKKSDVFSKDNDDGNFHFMEEEVEILGTLLKAELKKSNPYLIKGNGVRTAEAFKRVDVEDQIDYYCELDKAIWKMKEDSIARKIILESRAYKDMNAQVQELINFKSTVSEFLETAKNMSNQTRSSFYEEATRSLELIIRENKDFASKKYKLLDIADENFISDLKIAKSNLKDDVLSKYMEVVINEYINNSLLTISGRYADINTPALMINIAVFIHKREEIKRKSKSLEKFMKFKEMQCYEVEHKKYKNLKKSFSEELRKNELLGNVCSIYENLERKEAMLKNGNDKQKRIEVERNFANFIWGDEVGYEDGTLYKKRSKLDILDFTNRLETTLLKLKGEINSIKDAKFHKVSSDEVVLFRKVLKCVDKEHLKCLETYGGKDIANQKRNLIGRLIIELNQINQIIRYLVADEDEIRKKYPKEENISEIKNEMITMLDSIIKKTCILLWTFEEVSKNGSDTRDDYLEKISSYFIQSPISRKMMDNL